MQGVSVATGTRFHKEFRYVLARLGNYRHLGSRLHARIRRRHVTRLAYTEFTDNKLCIRRFKVQHLDRIRFKRADIRERLLPGPNFRIFVHNTIAHNHTQVIIIRRERIHLVEPFTIGLYKTVGSIHLNPSMVNAFR